MAWFTQGSEEYGEHGELLLQFFLDDEENDDRVVVRISEIVRCLKHFRESVLSNDEHDYEYEMAGNLWAAPLEGGTLTAEQVRKAIEQAKAELLESCEYVGDMGQRKSDVLKAFGKMERAIADELNATLGSGTCELHYGEDDDGYDGWYCDGCGGWFQAVRRDGRLVRPRHCQECGGSVKR